MLSKHLFFIMLTSLSFPLLGLSPISLQTFEHNGESFKAIININTPENDSFYADYFSLSADSPHVIINEWRPSVEPESKFDSAFKETKKLYLRPFQITILGKLNIEKPENFNLHLGYYQKSKKKNAYIHFPITFPEMKKDPVNLPNQYNSGNPKKSNYSKKKDRSFDSPKNLSWSDTIANLLKTTHSWGFRFLLALFLGIFLSLTPCIYPMIPITMGILQSQGSNSVIRNFILSLTYTVGIATTFAFFGLLAAFTGHMFGSIMNNTFVILFIVLLLGYLAGSMIGLYEMYIPRFLQTNKQNVQGGSLLSIFMFGALSGTVASPCLSPGLLLLLTIVTSIGSLLLGFLLLFAFGLGLGMPLLIIGTFSSSLQVLPKAGVWMIDIKQFFGFIMLATCFYFLSNIVPFAIITWLIALFLFATGIFYIRQSSNIKGIRGLVHSTIGIIAIAASVYAAFWAFKTSDPLVEQKSLWLYDFEQAKQRALKKNTFLLIDVGAPYCSICKAIDKKIFMHPSVQKELKNFISVKINDMEKDETTRALKKKFTIVGVPTFIIWNPKNNYEVKRWGSELYDVTPTQFINELSNILKNKNDKIG